MASQTEGFTDLVSLMPGVAFHTVCMILGMVLVTKAAAAKRAAVPQSGLPKQA